MSSRRLDDGGGGGSDGGSDGSVDLSEESFVRSYGSSISVDWGRLAKLLVISPLAAYFAGVTGAVRSVGLFAQEAYGTLADQLSKLITALLGQDGIFEVAWASARADVLGQGLASFALAVAVAGVTTWVASTGVRLLRE